MGLHIRVSFGEALTGLGLAAIGGAFAVMAHRLPATTDPGVPGPGGVPFALGLAVAGLGLLITIRSALSRDGTLIEIAERKAVISLLLLTACLVLLEPAGFMLSSFLFLFAGFWQLGDTPWQKSFAAAAVGAGMLWLLFTKALGVGLPYGALVEHLFR